MTRKLRELLFLCAARSKHGTISFLFSDYPIIIVAVRQTTCRQNLPPDQPPNLPLGILVKTLYSWYVSRARRIMKMHLSNFLHIFLVDSSFVSSRRRHQPLQFAHPYTHRCPLVSRPHLRTHLFTHHPSFTVHTCWDPLADSVDGGVLSQIRGRSRP